MRITLTTNRFLFSPRSMSLNILRPLTAMKPYRVRHTPPITQLGMVCKSAITGLKKLRTMHMIAAVKMVLTDAFLVIATQPTLSP